MDSEELERSGQAVRVRLEHGGRAHDLVLSAAGDDRVSVVVSGKDAGGTVTTELHGTMEVGDLAVVGRLLVLAADADFAYRTAGVSRFVVEQRQRHPNAYRPWTEADDERLAVRAAEGATVPDLVAEFGRNRGAIRSRLTRIGAAAESAS